MIRKIKNSEELKILFDLCNKDKYNKYLSFVYDISRSSIIDKKIDYNIAFDKAKDTLIVELDGEIIGFTYAVYCKYNNYCNYVDSLVSEKHRGKGIGRELFWAVIREAQNRGLTRLKIRCNKNNLLGTKTWKSFVGDPCGSIKNDHYWFVNIDNTNTIEQLQRRCCNGIQRLF